MSHDRTHAQDPARRAAAELRTYTEGPIGDLPEDITVLDTVAISTHETSESQDAVDEDKSVTSEQDEVTESVDAIAAASVDSEREIAPPLEDESVMTEEQVRIEEARFAPPVLNFVGASERNGIRLLMVTQDASVLAEESLSHARILQFAQNFLEIHVIVLTRHESAEPLIARMADNLWVYGTNSRYGWKVLFDGYRMANEQLAFAGGFRADLVVAEDPFESGVVARLLASRHGRPLQVHVFEDPFDPDFKNRDELNSIRFLAAKYLLKRADTIRTNSEHIRERISSVYPHQRDRCEVFPIYHNLAVWRDFQPTFDLKSRYPQFKFIILHVSLMFAKSHTKEVIIGTTPILKRYPTTGLVIVGNGPLRTDLEKIVIGLGLQNQVEFEPMSADVISHMKSANLLIHLSEDPEEDDVVLKAASVRLPMIIGNRGLGAQLFKDGESAFVCECTNPTCVAERINAFLNENQTRAKFALTAQDIVFERVRQDYEAYLAEYRKSIERGIVAAAQTAG